MFLDWIVLYNKISSLELDKSEGLCPECGGQTIDMQFVGDVTKRTGYFSMWCNTCLRGIHISRTRIPKNEVMLSFTDPLGTVTSRIPHFEQILPE
jgi:hypothetical protein